MSHQKLRLSLAELHFLIGIAAVATAITMIVAPDMTPNAVRVAVPRAILLSAVALLLIGCSALMAAWTSLQEDSSAKASFASSAALLVWALAQTLLAGVETPLMVVLVVAPVISFVLAAALYRAQRNRELSLTRGYSRITPSPPS